MPIRRGLTESGLPPGGGVLARKAESCHGWHNNRIYFCPRECLVFHQCSGDQFNKGPVMCYDSDCGPVSAGRPPSKGRTDLSGGAHPVGISFLVVDKHLQRLTSQLALQSLKVLVSCDYRRLGFVEKLSNNTRMVEDPQTATQLSVPLPQFRTNLLPIKRNVTPIPIGARNEGDVLVRDTTGDSDDRVARFVECPRLNVNPVGWAFEPFH